MKILMSEVYAMNNTVEEEEPCKTPAVIDNLWEYSPSKSTNASITLYISMRA